MSRYDRASNAITRREFGALTIGAGLSGLAAAKTHDGTLDEQEVTIPTPSGSADAYFVHPALGLHPAVLIWPDIFGLRPAFRQMARRLAGAGYSVLVVNPFYRLQRAPTSEPGADFDDAATRQALMSMAKSLTAESAAIDAKAFVDWLDQQPAVDGKRKMATTGYCMGGPLVMRTAAARADRIGAGATFHGGGLATQAADSPHRLIPRMRAQFLIAIAANDDQRDPNAKTLLRDAFDAAHLEAEIEVYAGTLHGWCPPDSRVYDEAAAERAWQRMLALFKRALGG
ncbi:MAG: dienelactone hydrolase family protein [Steroidobacteraceae bacterium]